MGEVQGKICSLKLWRRPRLGRGGEDGERRALQRDAAARDGDVVAARDGGLPIDGHEAVAVE